MLRRCSLSIVFSASCLAQYAPIDIPGEWTFKSKTPAYSVDQPGRALGEFQPGIQVEVTGVEDHSGQWQVTYKRYGQPDLMSLIDPPNLALAKAEAFTRIEEDIAGFSILKKLLEQREVWPSSAAAMGDWLVSDRNRLALASGTEEKPLKLALKNPGEDASAWGIRPLAASIDYLQADNPRIVIEFWNKGDAFRSTTDPSKANRLLQDKFGKIQAVFRTYREDPARSASSEITALRVREKVYLLPNDLRASIRYDYGEHLIITFQSIEKLAAMRPPAYDPERFKDRIAEKVTRSQEGHTFIDGIPMINQGEKGYCAAATLARVLQFYGYAVDQHGLADLAETEAQIAQNDRGGTLRKNMIQAMGRICGSTPFRLRQIKKERPEAILPIIEQGIPIIWLIPGHARLLIGLHPENNEIVYSDSWGMEHAYKTQSWDYFVNANREMWILTPR